MKFNAKNDLDPVRLYNRAEAEAKLIYSKPSTRRDRSLENMETWRKYPEKLYIFIGNKESCDYHLHGIYEWNGEQFCLQEEESIV
jgi:hypothetical protein